jgi:hypothetical protein
MSVRPAQAVARYAREGEAAFGMAARILPRAAGASATASARHGAALVMRGPRAHLAIGAGIEGCGS